MSSEEEDYMSDFFLTKCEKNNTSFSVTSIKKDIRPGLIRDRSKQREVEVAAKKARIDEEYKKYTKPDPAERLLEGLNTALDSGNKGFAMLSKMGYKQGHALGKSSTAIVEPIGISLKYDRAGLGRAAAIRELQQKKQELRRKKLLDKACGASVSTEEYRQRMIQKAEEKFIERSLEKCQRTCQKLDAKEYVKKPAMPWFWPDESKSQDKEDEPDQEKEKDEEEEFELSEKLEMLTLYLRTSYNYCHWCGVQYEDLDDMTEDCPGPCKDDH